MREVKFIPISDLTHNNIFFTFSEIASNTRRGIIARLKGDNLSDEEIERLKKKWNMIFLRFYKIFVCDDCKYKNEDLKWHQENNVTIGNSFDVVRKGYVFECSCFEKM